MLSHRTFFLASLLCLLINPVFAKAKASPSGCCNQMGGISYCDSSAGRMVCKNGFYSACYCTPHAIMDLQLLRGCCLWRGGVLPASIGASGPNGLVVCNDGSVSEECSAQFGPDKVASW